MRPTTPRHELTSDSFDHSVAGELEFFETQRQVRAQQFTERTAELASIAGKVLAAGAIVGAAYALGRRHK